LPNRVEIDIDDLLRVGSVVVEEEEEKKAAMYRILVMNSCTSK